MKKLFLICVLFAATGISIFCIIKFVPNSLLYMPQPVVALYVKGYVLRDIAREEPDIYIIPIPIKRQVQTLHYEQTMYISRAGITFKVPWKNFIRKKKTVIPFGQWTDKEFINQGLVKKSDKSTLLVYTFPKNKRIGIGDAQIPETVTYLRRTRDAFTKVVLEEGSLKSDYDFRNAILHANPKEITWLTPKKKLLSSFFFTIMKIVSTSASAKCGIFEFETKNGKGFQFGNPQKCHTVEFELFSKNGIGIPVHLFGTNLTQEEWDFILSSVSVQ